MVIRKFIAKDMQEAMEKIGKELGNDAVILNKRYFRKKGFFNMFKKEELEVTVAHDPGVNKRNSVMKKAPKPKPKVAVPVTVKQQDSDNNLLDMMKIDSINTNLNEFNKTLREFSSRIKTPEEKPESVITEKTSVFMNRMIENGVEFRLAQAIAKDVEEIIALKDLEREQVLRELIIDMLGEPSPIKLKKHRRTIVVFVGPTGAGKTTSLVKLAAHFANEKQLKVGVINTDTYRVAAQEQLNIFSNILNVPCHVVYGIDDFSVALKAQEDRDLVLIDTAGKSVFDPEYKTNISAMLNLIHPDEIFLTLPITNSFDVCKNIIKSSAYMGEYKILLTKLDEVMHKGNILNISNYSNKRLSYVAVGQQIPDDIEIADVEKIALEIVKPGEEL